MSNYDDEYIEILEEDERLHKIELEKTKKELPKLLKRLSEGLGEETIKKLEEDTTNGRLF